MLRVQLSTMSKKIWLSMHLRNFGWTKSYVRPHLHVKWGEILRFKHPARCGVKSHSQPVFKKEKKTTTTRLSLSFFRFFDRVGPVSEISLSLKILLNFRRVLIRGWAGSLVPHILFFPTGISVSGTKGLPYEHFTSLWLPE